MDMDMDNVHVHVDSLPHGRGTSSATPRRTYTASRSGYARRGGQAIPPRLGVGALAAADAKIRARPPSRARPPRAPQHCVAECTQYSYSQRRIHEVRDLAVWHHRSSAEGRGERNSECWPNKRRAGLTMGVHTPHLWRVSVPLPTRRPRPLLPRSGIVAARALEAAGACIHAPPAPWARRARVKPRPSSPPPDGHARAVKGCPSPPRRRRRAA